METMTYALLFGTFLGWSVYFSLKQIRAIRRDLRKIERLSK